MIVLPAPEAMWTARPSERQMSMVPTRHRFVLALWFGFGCEPHSLEALARILGTSERQAEAKLSQSLQRLQGTGYKPSAQCDGCAAAGAKTLVRMTDDLRVMLCDWCAWRVYQLDIPESSARKLVTKERKSSAMVSAAWMGTHWDPSLRFGQRRQRAPAPPPWPARPLTPPSEPAYTPISGAPRSPPDPA